ncbi:hypothetical protein JCM10207_003653 [Rhodosporidiobolus poonsookiae]
MPKSANPSPRKPSHSHLKERQPTLILDDAPPPASQDLSSADLQALAEDYDLEASSHLRLLAHSLAARLATLDRHWTDLVSQLDHRVQQLSLGRYVDEFQCDPQKALRQVVEEGMRPVEMGEGEKGARKRKRNLPLSPRGTSDEDPFAAPPTASKKARSNGLGTVPASAQKRTANGKGAVPGSARGIRVVSGGGASPGSTRKPSRSLRVRPSQSAAASSSGAGNFIYRASSAASNSVLPTPSLARTAGTVRRPKRGESIVLRSMNGSPLGEFVASDVEAEEEEEEDGEGSEEWDLMDAHEASRSERPGHASPSKSKSKRLTKPPRSASTSTSQVRVPTAPSFAVALPASAPSYDALRAAFLDEMRREVETQARAMGLGEEQRRRLVEAVGRAGNGERKTGRSAESEDL